MLGAIAVRSCVALVILLSCCILSVQAVEYPQAQYNRGVNYWYGSGVTQDYVEAANWFRKAADQGFVGAQHNTWAYRIATAWGLLRTSTRRWLGSARRQIMDTPRRSSL